ncbi:hypothetical protein BDV93DRAFT_610776 [Ceratobasidium sp. AG-I]|nr:hypothetical protein BDV93DRAFT_610776 [Ceratobasidium sp. AG-I]
MDLPLPDLETITPYFVPPLQPLTGIYTLNRLHYAERKFITSSWARDMITGSKPTYGRVEVMYPWTQLATFPLSYLDNGTFHPNAQTTVYGAVLQPSFLISAPETTQASLQGGLPDYMCQTVEDYRTASPLDILASIGGLLALLQGIHAFLFGRPLFWGLFGTKMVSPFGILGTIATKGFRERLSKHYRTASTQGDTPPISSTGVATSVAGNGTASAQIRFDMTRFLLDYVLDMGPAMNRPPRLESPGSELPRSSLEMDELLEGQSARNLHTSNTSDSLLTIDRSGFGPVFSTSDESTNTSSRRLFQDS